MPSRGMCGGGCGSSALWSSRTSSWGSHRSINSCKCSEHPGAHYTHAVCHAMHEGGWLSVSGWVCSACSRRGEVRDDRQLIDGIIRGFRSIMGPLSFKSYLQVSETDGRL